MQLRLEQLVYTSFVGIGLRVLAQAKISQEIKQVLLQQISFKYWNSYNQPSLGYRAVYLH